MALQWFMVDYKRRDLGSKPGRYCAMDDFNTQIQADGGDWSETEILGDKALVKVNASPTTLTTIGNTAGFFGIPAKWVTLTDDLSSMTAGERNQMQNAILSLGYTKAEIDGAMGNTLALWQQNTLDDLLSLCAIRRLKPRYDTPTDTIILDGPVQPVRPVESVDNAVS